MNRKKCSKSQDRPLSDPSAYTDKTLIRDVLAYELWREMGHYAPRTRFVELFIVTNGMDRPHPGPLPREREQVASGSIEAPAQTEAANANEAAPRQEPRSAAVSAASLSGVSPLGNTPDGTSDELAGREAYATIPSLKAQLSALNFSNYHGVYVLMEKIKRGKNRINIQKSTPDPADSSWLTGGYILKKDRLNSGEVGFMSAIGMQFAFEDPKERDMLPEPKTWLMEYQFRIAFPGAMRDKRREILYARTEPPCALTRIFPSAAKPQPKILSKKEAVHREWYTSHERPTDCMAHTIAPHPSLSHSGASVPVTRMGEGAEGG